MILVDQWNMLNSCEDPYEKKNEKKKTTSKSYHVLHTRLHIILKTQSCSGFKEKFQSLCKSLTIT